MTSTSVAPTPRSRPAIHSAVATMSPACSWSADTLGMRAISSRDSIRRSRDASRAASMAGSIETVSEAARISVIGLLGCRLGLVPIVA